ncbi:MAG: sigma-54-dependent Fis family transcriptional regulator, partial [Candidatus Zixiibacteriota bacterium]
KKKLIQDSVEPLEKDFIIRALRKTGGNISEAARVTQMGRRQFQRLMRRYNLELQDIFNPA